MDIVPTITRILEQMPDVQLAVLFGSAARATLRRGSDVDLAIRLADSGCLQSALGVTLERAVGRPVDLVLLDTASPLLRLEIARHGTVLVERQPGDWSAFRAKAMIDWWDWAPTARMMHDVVLARLSEEAARGPS